MTSAIIIVLGVIMVISALLALYLKNLIITFCNYHKLKSEKVQL